MNNKNISVTVMCCYAFFNGNHMTDNKKILQIKINISKFDKKILTN